MKNLCLLPIACCLFAVLPSCKQKTDYSKEISQLDSAEIVLTKAEKNLLSVDTNTLRSSYNFAKEKLQLISEIISKDTIKKKTAIFLSDIYVHSGNILNLLDNKKYLERAVKESQQRISDLKHDLTEGLIEKNKSAEYIVNEVNSLEKIYEAVNKAIEKAKSGATELDSLKTQIIALADSLNLRKAK